MEIRCIHPARAVLAEGALWSPDGLLHVTGRCVSMEEGGSKAAALAGGLFAIDVGVSGLRETPFAG